MLNHLTKRLVQRLTLLSMLQLITTKKMLGTMADKKQEGQKESRKSSGPLDIAEKGSELGKDWFGNLIKKDVPNVEEKNRKQGDKLS